MTRHYSATDSFEAEAAFDRLFRSHEVPDDVDTHAISEVGEISLPALLGDSGLVASRSEGRRMIKQGAVKIDGERVDDEFVDAADVVDAVLQVGKRRFARIVRG